MKKLWLMASVALAWSGARLCGMDQLLNQLHKLADMSYEQIDKISEGLKNLETLNEESEFQLNVAFPQLKNEYKSILGKIEKLPSQKVQLMSPAYKRKNYIDLKMWRNELLKKLTEYSIQEGSKKKLGNQRDALVEAINQLSFPDETWGNWLLSFVTEKTEPYAQWPEEYMTSKRPKHQTWRQWLKGKEVTFETGSLFENDIKPVLDFAQNESNDANLRAIAYLYVLWAKLLQYMITHVYEYKKPILTRSQKVLSTAALLAVGIGGFKVGAKWREAYPLKRPFMPLPFDRLYPRSSGVDSK